LSTTEWQIFRVVGRNATLNGTQRDSDAWLKAYWGRFLFPGDETLMYDVAKIPLDIGRDFGVTSISDPTAIISDVAIGFFGLIRQFAWLEIYDNDEHPVTPSLDQCCADAKAPGGGKLLPDGAVKPIGPRDNSTIGTFDYTPVAGDGQLARSTDPTSTGSRQRDRSDCPHGIVLGRQRLVKRKPRSATEHPVVQSLTERTSRNFSCSVRALMESENPAYFSLWRSLSAATVDSNSGALTG
jgi:hypothetical protein